MEVSGTEKAFSPAIAHTSKGAVPPLSSDDPDCMRGPADGYWNLYNPLELRGEIERRRQTELGSHMEQP